MSMGVKVDFRARRSRASALDSAARAWHDAGMIPLLGETMESLTGKLGAMGHKPYRARQIMEWVHEKRVGDFAAMTDLPAELRAELARAFPARQLEQVRLSGSQDTTRKFLFRLPDGQFIESVFIPASPALYGETSDRKTLCVSTQVGCAYGCKFCASGLRGWKRNLLPGEITAQVMAAEQATGERVDNIVFMGMGEPLANLKNLSVTLEILNAPWGFEIGARHITVSTSGLVPQIRELADHPVPVRLAISLHGASDEVREQIMPVNKKYPLRELFDACSYFASRRKQKLGFEYILIAGVNDSLEQARLLASHARRLDAKVNLIPYNTVEGLSWERPSEARQQEFVRAVRDGGVVATIRREKGHDIDAACGQLRLRVEDELAAASA
jgi:23S rRNA (adenine2503-C2)-methyltransferase